MQRKNSFLVKYTGGVAVSLLFGAALLNCGSTGLELEGGSVQTGGVRGAETTGGSAALGGATQVETGGVGGVRTDPATGGTTPVGDRPVPPDDACVRSIIRERACVACHSAAIASAIGANLVLEGENLGARLSQTRATYAGVTNPSACVPGNYIIDREHPENSLLLKKVLGTQECGDKMPLGTGLPASEAECIRNWVMKF